MWVSVLSLPLVEGQGLDGDDLDAFCERNDVLACREYVLQDGRTPHLVLVLEYKPRDEGEQRSRPAARTGRRTVPEQEPDPRKSLPPEDRPLFDALREWRSLRAAGDGVPPYIVMTNRQLAEVARARPATKATLRGLAGIGEAKVERYFADIQEVLAAIERTDEPAPVAAPAVASSDAAEARVE